MGYYNWNDNPIERCNVTSCKDIFSNESTNQDICSGHGVCFEKDNCSCSSDDYFGLNCQYWSCFGVLNNDSSVCSNHGECIDKNNCSCLLNYTHSPHAGDFSNCSSFTCFGKYFDDVDNGYDSACTGFGNCTKPDFCDCFDGYNTTSDCHVWECHGVDNTETTGDGAVCSGHGDCKALDDCQCTDPQYAGQNCGEFTCFNISRLLEEACGDFGRCVDIDDCDCDNGYQSTYEQNGDVCDTWKCYSVHKDVSSSVCSARGVCSSPDNCDCKNDYEGDDCEKFRCGFDSKSPMTCNGHGTCLSPGKCKCQSGYSGVLCQTNDLYLTVMTPILGTFGVLVLIVLILLFFCFICALCLCICVMCLGIIGFVVLASVVMFQKLRMVKFEKLNDIDLLLEEQKAEKDSSIAHIRINKNLFEINYEEIKIKKILGEGGSSSTVYLANWKGQLCAFKCFKTRLICSSQDNFDDFEKEVEVFSSISHPNVVAFFGCSLNPPRVGILMELCEKGESLEYIVKYEKKNEKRYPLKERIRMLMEIISALDYLHSRSIIHRDLKCENVLLDKSERCKLMDFGLSKISERLSRQKTKKVGTSYYMAPEVATGNHAYNEKCDVFSFGIMIWVLIVGLNEPYGDQTQCFNIEMKVASDPNCRPETKRMEYYLRDDDDDDGYEWLVESAKLCWQHESFKRPSFAELGKIFSEKKSKLSDDVDDSRYQKVSLNNKDKNEVEIENLRNRNRELEERNKDLEEKLENLRKKFESFSEQKE